MKLNRKSTYRNIICGLFATLAVGCSTKKEAEPEVITKTPVVVEKTAVVKQEITPVNLVSYGVQIGAYRDFDVQFATDIKNIKHNGLSNYILGSFKTQKEAHDFLKIIQDLKIKDAFVVKMQDGKIIE